MFDTPDYSYLCIAPLIGIFFWMCFAAFGFAIRFISKKISGKDIKRLQSIFSLIGAAIGMAICIISASLGIP